MKKLKYIFIFLLINFKVFSQESAPAGFMLKDLASEEVKMFQDVIESKPTIINFWATYCVPCKQEMPELQNLIKEFSEIQVIFINIDSSKEKEKVSQLVNDWGITQTVLLDVYQVAAKAYIKPTPSVPATFLIRSDGKIMYKSVGYSKKTIPELREHLKKLK